MLTTTFKKLIKELIMLINLGYSIKIIQGVLGHADYNTTANIYGHLSQKAETEAFNSIAEALAN